MPKGIYIHKAHSTETRLKMSLSRRGNKHPMYGKKHSPESLAKMSATHKLYRHTEETKEKIGSAHRGKMPKNIDLLHQINRGRRHRLWKGKRASYGAIHAWIRSNKGKPTVCTSCGITSEETKIEWSNKDHKYRRAVVDYTSLCCRCHWAYDVEQGLRKTSEAE